MASLLVDDTFEQQTFTGLEATAAVLSGKELYRCTFEHCRLQESVWKGAKLEACTFRQCDLTRATLAQTALRGVTFEGCKLMGIDFSKVSTHPELSFTGCMLRYSSFADQNLKKTKFLSCMAREVNFHEVDLSECDFTGSDLAGSAFRGCTLARTDFRGATGLFLDPARNRVKDTGVPVEAAVELARSLGLLVGGYDDGPLGSKRR
jgi:uncharacterized protein YjbI with pentapeptide repeats